jgi:hypothetical protein
VKARLRCPYCGQDVWSYGDGAHCTDPDYATGFATTDRSCGAVWDSVGVLEEPPIGRWRVRLELCPDGEPPPAVWTVRNTTGAIEFITDNHPGAMLVADARARRRPDPILDDVLDDDTKESPVSIPRCPDCDEIMNPDTETPCGGTPDPEGD